MPGFFDVLNRRANASPNRGFRDHPTTVRDRYGNEDDGEWSDHVAPAAASASAQSRATAKSGDCTADDEGSSSRELADGFSRGLRLADDGLFHDNRDERPSDGRRTQQSLLDECGDELWSTDARNDRNRYDYEFGDAPFQRSDFPGTDGRATRAASEDVFASPRLRGLEEREVPEVLTRDVRASQSRRDRAGPSQSAGGDRGQYDDWGKKNKKKREKYMPVQKTECELFAPETQIHCGEHFDALCDDQPDSDSPVFDVAVSYGEEQVGDDVRISDFAECNFESAMMKNLKLFRMERPTKVQQYVIPLIMQYKSGDILACAPTGSGKTAAFMLPIIHRISRTKLRRSASQPTPAQHVGANGRRFDGAPYALILAPTRELCHQLYEDAKRLSIATGVSACVSYGEMPMPSNIRAIRDGCDIFVTTVTRLKHFVRDGHITLRNIKFWVMDEADRILNPDDYNYEALYRIKTESDINPRHRTFMFSATQTVVTLDTLERFIEPSNVFIINVGRINAVVDTVAQQFELVSKYDKRDRLMQLLICRAKKHKAPDGEVTYSVGRTIVFVALKNISERLAHDLAWSGFSVTNINGDRSLRQRFEAVEKFTKGIYDVCITTDLTARGLNFPDVEQVINYDMPTVDSISYIHRIGRTGRAGNEGRAISFFDPEVDARFVDFYMTTIFGENNPPPQFIADIYEAQLRMQSQYNFQPIGHAGSSGDR